MRWLCSRAANWLRQQDLVTKAQGPTEAAPVPWLRFPELDVLRIQSGQYRWQLHLQLADQPVGDARFKFALNGFGYIQVGVYDENPKYLGLRKALVPAFFSGSAGVLVPVELAWLPKFDGGRLPGSYKFGGWADTSEAPDVVNLQGLVSATNPDEPAAQSRGRFRGYINFQQQLTRTDTANPKGGLSAFLNAVMADDRKGRY